MEIRTYSRKQAGVIYSNIKRGKLTMSREAVSMMYDLAGTAFVSNSNSASEVTEISAAIKNAVDAIFSDDLDCAQACLDRFAA